MVGLKTRWNTAEHDDAGRPDRIRCRRRRAFRHRALTCASPAASVRGSRRSHNGPHGRADGAWFEGWHPNNAPTWCCPVAASKGSASSGRSRRWPDSGYAPQRVPALAERWWAAIPVAAQRGVVTASQLRCWRCRSTIAHCSTRARSSESRCWGPRSGCSPVTASTAAMPCTTGSRSSLAEYGVSHVRRSGLPDRGLPPEQRYRLVVTVADVTLGQPDPPTVGLPTRVRARSRPAVGSRCGPGVDSHPVLLSAGHPGGRRWQRNRPWWTGTAVELPDRFAEPAAGQAALADVRRHPAARSAGRERAADPGAAATAPADRTDAVLEAGGHHDPGGP